MACVKFSHLSLLICIKSFCLEQETLDFSYLNTLRIRQILIVEQSINLSKCREWLKTVYDKCNVFFSVISCPFCCWWKYCKIKCPVFSNQVPHSHSRLATYITVLTLAQSGGRLCNPLPLSFFEGSVKAAARSAAKFDIAYGTTFIHMSWKF